MDELVACVIGLAVGSSVNFSQAAAQVIDFYMREDRSKERAALIAACSAPDGDASAMELVRGYVREGMRLNPQFGGLFRVCVQDDVVPQGTGFADMQVKKGDWLFGSFKNAHLNVCLLSSIILPPSSDKLSAPSPTSRTTSPTPRPSTRRGPRVPITCKARVSTAALESTSSHRRSPRSCVPSSGCLGCGVLPLRRASAQDLRCANSTPTMRCISRRLET